MLMLLIFVAGAMGGAINALLSDNGFLMPKWEMVGGNKIFRLGFFGNIFISGVGACVSWGFYGPFAAADVLGHSTQPLALTLSALVGAILVGIAGARWVTNEVDKLMLRAVASEAAKTQPNPDMASQIAKARPAEALMMFQKQGPKPSRSLPQRAKITIDNLKLKSRKSFRRVSMRVGRLASNGSVRMSR